MEKVTLHFDGVEVNAIVKNDKEHMQKHWTHGNFYEVQRNGLLSYIYATEKKGGKIIDIGASIGNHSLFFAAVMQAEELHSIEPHPDSYNHLCENMKSNNLTLAGRIYHMALGEKPGLCFMQSESETNVGMMQVKENAEGNVHIMTIDSRTFFEGYDIIKIDVEHYNEQLLKGAKETFTRGKGNIYIEAETPEVLAVTDKYMNEYGYQRVPDLVLNHTPTYKYIKA